MYGVSYYFNIHEVLRKLNGSDYDLEIRNGDTDSAINLIVGTIGSTPETSISEANANLLGNLDITPDSDSILFTSIAGANILEVSNTGIYVHGSVGSSSDSRLKENTNEVSTKTCYGIVKFIKVKEFSFKGKVNKQAGFIAQDILNSKIASSEWSNFVSQGKDDFLRGKTIF